MAHMINHIGVIVNTSKRCAVVFMQLPEDTDHALVVDTDALPESILQPMMEVLESKEGQQSPALADILARRLVPHTGKTMLATLHEGRYLERVSVDNVMLTPRPNVSQPLRKVLEAMGRVVGGATPPETNFFQDQQTANTEDERNGLAKSYLAQAQLLLDDASRLQQKAYAIVPSLNPMAEITTNTKVSDSVDVADGINVAAIDNVATADGIPDTLLDGTSSL